MDDDDLIGIDEPKRLPGGEEHRATVIEEIRPSMRDLLAAVGEVLLMWGFLEQEMERSLSSASGRKSSADLRPILSRWRRDVVRRIPIVTRKALLADVKDVASVRNLIAHGLRSASASVSGEEAKIVCRALDGEKHTITLSKLLETEGRIHSLRERVRMTKKVGSIAGRRKPVHGGLT